MTTDAFNTWYESLEPRAQEIVRVCAFRVLKQNNDDEYNMYEYLGMVYRESMDTEVRIITGK